MAFAVSVAGSAVAASTEHEHVALPTDVTLSMTDALDYTVTRYPSFLELDARGEEAQAWSERGDSWLAGQPALSFRYQTDRWGDDRGLPIDDVVIEGARRRLRPVLMTASIAAFGLVPLLFATGPGSEIQRPLAVVVIGGLITATLLTLIILPILYRRFGAAEATQ